MNNTLKILPRPHNPISILILGWWLLLAFSTNLYAITDKRRHSLAGQGGIYMISASEETNSDAPMEGLGSVALDYSFYITPTYSVTFGYNTIFPLTSLSISALVWGMDLSGSYCFFNCISDHEKWDDTLAITSFDRWGMDAGLGVTQRLMSLKLSTRASSGAFIKTNVYYFFSPTWKIVSGLKYSMLAVGDKNSVNIIEVNGGMAFDF